MKRLACALAMFTVAIGGCGGDSNDSNGVPPASATTATDSSPAPTLPAANNGVQCPFTAEQVSSVLESAVEQVDDASHVCAFMETEPSGSFGTPIEVLVRKTNAVIFDDPELEEVELGDEAGVLLYQGSLFMRLGDLSIEIQVPGGAGPGRDDRTVLLALGALAADAIE